MNMERKQGFVVSKTGHIVGEAKNYDPFSREGHIMMYWDDSGYRNSTLEPAYRVMSKNDIESDKGLAKSLEETEYQLWRFANKALLTDEYVRVRKNMYNLDQFCREYYLTKQKGILSKYLTDVFSECYEYTEFAYFIDLKRERGLNPQWEWTGWDLNPRPLREHFPYAV